MSDKDRERSHSVVLDEQACKGCTVCVTTCPAEAIRVRDGKARIMEDRCIDCGECIRRCPHHAKKARADEFPANALPPLFSAFAFRIALPAPSLYGQFPPSYSIDAIHRALLAIGFDAVYPVSAATGAIAAASRTLLDRQRHPGLPRPLISSSCPAVIRIIQIRFPTLLEHIAPVIAPMEEAGRRARALALARNEAIPPASRLRENDIGVFFISPCAGKITEAKAPQIGENSSIDGVFSMRDIHIPLLAALAKIGKAGAPVGSDPDRRPHRAEEIAWGRAGGEAEATLGGDGDRYLAVDGMDQCIKILGAVEDGTLSDIDFLELMACTGGCAGGPLTVTQPALARHILRYREERMKAPVAEAGGVGADGAVARQSSGPESAVEPALPVKEAEQTANATESCLRTGMFQAKPALLLDPDYQKAMEMLSDIDEIQEGLPGLDCGCCGAPNCRSLAEDIVRGTANRSDCVIILKEQYRELLERGHKGHDQS